tara:strand:+ start:4082 stop:4447 length:366 start_codon:yes stop_codon:yes gene_type:complete
MTKDHLRLENIEVWARVGVLEKERKFGQLFSLNAYLWADYSKCSKKDDISLTVDYSILIQEIRLHAKTFTCLTIEKYSDEIIQLILRVYDFDRIEIHLTKCNPPIYGFNGNISIIKIYEKS